MCGFLKLVLRTLIVFAVASDAVTLRSCDGVDHSVDTLSAIAHSGLLKGLIGGPNSSDALIPLPEVANSELLSIARFINVVGAHQVSSHSTDDLLLSIDVYLEFRSSNWPPSGLGVMRRTRHGMKRGAAC